jgi:hypothetical protein
VISMTDEKAPTRDITVRAIRSQERALFDTIQ